ncbi:MAG: hypothetical protein JNL98_13690 [Bryobacterales bacterium]|nr:hypothetical protein [Bryobacterales bacterium]
MEFLMRHRRWVMRAAAALASFTMVCGGADKVTVTGVQGDVTGLTHSYGFSPDRGQLDVNSVVLLNKATTDRFNRYAEEALRRLTPNGRYQLVNAIGYNTRSGQLYVSDFKDGSPRPGELSVQEVWDHPFYTAFVLSAGPRSLASVEDVVSTIRNAMKWDSVAWDLAVRLVVDPTLRRCFGRGSSLMSEVSLGREVEVSCQASAAGVKIAVLLGKRFFAGSTLARDYQNPYRFEDPDGARFKILPTKVLMVEFGQLEGRFGRAAMFENVQRPYIREAFRRKLPCADLSAMVLSSRSLGITLTYFGSEATQSDAWKPYERCVTELYRTLTIRKEIGALSALLQAANRTAAVDLSGEICAAGVDPGLANMALAYLTEHGRGAKTIECIQGIRIPEGFEVLREKAIGAVRSRHQ